MKMNRLVRLMLVVLQVGGGFVGLLLLLASHPWKADTPPHIWLISIVFACVFLFGIVAGLALSEGSRLGITLSAWYQGLQIPVISLPIITYSFYSGAQLGIGLFASKTVFMAQLGTRMTLVFYESAQATGLGVNLLALGLFIYLLAVRANDSKRTGESEQDNAHESTVNEHQDQSSNSS